MIKIRDFSKELGCSLENHRDLSTAAIQARLLRCCGRGLLRPLVCQRSWGLCPEYLWQLLIHTITFTPSLSGIVTRMGRNSSAGSVERKRDRA